MQPCWASICAGLAGVEGVAAALGDEKAEEEGHRERGQVFEYGLLWGVHDSSCSRGRVARPGDESGTALSVVLRVQEYFQSSPKSGPPLTLEALACLHPSKEGEAVIETKHFTIGDFQRLQGIPRDLTWPARQGGRGDCLGRYILQRVRTRVASAQRRRPDPQLGPLPFGLPELSHSRGDSGWNVQVTSRASERWAQVKSPPSLRTPSERSSLGSLNPAVGNRHERRNTMERGLHFNQPFSSQILGHTAKRLFIHAQFRGYSCSIDLL